MKLKLFSISLAVLLLTACTPTAEEAGTTFTYGTTAYSLANANVGLNPHNDYAGWSAVRYGVGETLFRYSATMEPEPFLASGYRQVSDTVWEITLKEDIHFSSGRLLDGQAVKECIESLLAVHDRAPYDLKISNITAEGQTVTFETTEPVPAFLNYLSDPYGAIIDMDYGVTEDKNVAGTGPFVATAVSDTEIVLDRNEAYWNGTVGTDHVVVKSITDGDTLTLALQSGEIDAAQGLPYASLPIFTDHPDYQISATETSRAFFVQSNLSSSILQDPVVRQAIAMSIDKEGFVSVLLGGHGSVATGPFPNDTVTTPSFDPTAAKQLLLDAGYEDTDGDGFLEQDGENLTLRWLSYPSRQELPLLAELAKSNLADIGIDLTLNVTASHNDILKTNDWDLYASAFVTAPTGDPQYFFTTHALATSAKNRGGFYSESLEALASQMADTFDAKERAALGTQMAQLLVDDASFLFVSHLTMSLVMTDQVDGFVAHPSDYYEITADLTVS